jgi:two-component system, NtrC family, response regulator GlrR
MLMTSSAEADTTRALVARPHELTYRRLQFRVLAGPDVGMVAESSGTELAVGTDPANGLMLTDSTVSRNHCVVSATESGFFLRDLGSTNGTTIDGVRVVTAYVAPGSVVGLGATSLRFELSDGGDVHEPLSDATAFGDALGSSAAMRRIFALLPRVAAADSTLLLEGETGTGKGLIADAVHGASPRSAGPFVVVDCGSIPPTLIESELFGHEKGAFTGAHTTRAGAFEAADGGTLFLDELGELPLDMQPKLLRALEDRQVKRVGSNRQISMNVRVIAATNRDLREEVNRGRFRSDLYYRLYTIRLRIPALRERREDIPLLVSHFYRQFSGQDIDPPAELVTQFCRHDWPGNVRELRSAVERALLMGDLATLHELGPSVEDSGLPGGQAPVAHEPFDPSLSFRAAKERAMGRWTRWYVEELVSRSDGNLSKAARAARMDRNHLRELLRRYDLS